jgi:hypothetical protein
MSTASTVSPQWRSQVVGSSPAPTPMTKARRAWGRSNGAHARAWTYWESLSIVGRRATDWLVPLTRR